jgi:hypothetical protein
VPARNSKNIQPSRWAFYMSHSRNSTTLSLQEQLVDALKNLQNIPGMHSTLQPSIDALQNKSRTFVPNDDHKNLSLFRKLILENHKDKVTEDDLHELKILIEQAQDREVKHISKKQK